MMDEAGLDSGTFLNGKKGMSRIVVEVRSKLYTEFMAYLKRLEDKSDGAE